jgi:hypothetical protein
MTERQLIHDNNMLLIKVQEAYKDHLMTELDKHESYDDKVKFLNDLYLDLIMCQKRCKN